MKPTQIPVKIACLLMLLGLSGQTFALTCTTDADGDGKIAQVCGGNDCDDTNPNDGVADADGDGSVALACGGADCDDTDANRYPGNVEVCDNVGHDEDCDYTTFGTRDADGDGFIDEACVNYYPDGTRTGGEDCDDSRRNVNPLVPEVCNGRDDNCDRAVDDETAVNQYTDWDLDGYGDPNDGPFRVCPGTAGFSTLSNDCDDENPAIKPGDQVCVMGAPEALLTCDSNGQWVAGTCPTGTVCVSQSNGIGLCTESKTAGKKNK